LRLALRAPRIAIEQTVVLGEMSVQGMLLKVKGLPERMQLAVEAGAKTILIPSENKRAWPRSRMRCSPRSSGSSTTFLPGL